MKLYGLMVVQNEGDIIEDTLEFLRSLNIYETIFFYDLGSQDDTFNKAKKFSDALCQPQILDEVYTEKLRYDLLVQNRQFYQKGDWLAIIDADEFYYDNPLDLIKIAEQENATYIKTYQAQFMFTDEDLRNFQSEDQTLPIYARRKYYLVNWSDIRFFKYLPEKGGVDLSRPCTRRLLNRHYQYRTPAQINKRIKQRLQNKITSIKLPGRQTWTQIFSSNWEDYIVPHKLLFKLNGDKIKFGIPTNLFWKYYNSKYHTSSILPQVAMALMKEFELSKVSVKPNMPDLEKMNGANHISESCGKGEVSFLDYFGSKVYKEVVNHFRAYEWRDAIYAITTLTLYYINVILRAVYFRTTCYILRVQDVIWNVATNFRRLLLQRSTGKIVAQPNPIEVSKFSSLATTTLIWKAANAEKVEIRRDAPDGELLSHAPSAGKISTGNLVRNGTVFYLQDASADLPLTSTNTLARVTVKVTRGKKIII